MKTTAKLTKLSALLAGACLALTGSLYSQDGPFPPDEWPASADGEKLVHFGTVDFSLTELGDGWEETLTVLSGGDQATEPMMISGFEGVKVTGNYLNIADFDYSVWEEHESIDVLVQVFGNEAVLGADGNPRTYQFLTGTLPEITFPAGGSIPVEGKNSQWNWVLFTVPNDQRPSGEGRYVGVVPDDAQGAIGAGGVNGGTIRVETVPGWIVRAVAFGEPGAFGTAEQVNRFAGAEACADEPATNHAFIDINNGTNEHMEVLTGGDQTSAIEEGVGPEGDKRRAVRAESSYLNFGVTDDYLGASCSDPRAVKICIEYYDDPALAGSFFGPDAYATDNQGGVGFIDFNRWQPTRGTGEWVRQSYTQSGVSLFGVNTAPLTGGLRLSFDEPNIFISRFDIAVMRVGDHPLAGQDPLEDCFEDPAVCAGEYGLYAELDLANDVFDGLAQGNSGGDQEMIEEEAGPADDRRLAVRAAHGDGTVGSAHNYINFALIDEPFGPSSQPNARLAICLTYWDNPDLVGATIRPEAYRSVRNGTEGFAFMPPSVSYTIRGTDTWREAYFEVPDIKFSGVNQGPQAAARFITSGKIHVSRVRYGVIRSCGPTADMNPLEECKPQDPSLDVSLAAIGELRLSWPVTGNNWILQESTDIAVWDDSAETPQIEGEANVLTIPTSDPLQRYFRLRQ